MIRAIQYFTPQRLAAVLASAVGWTIGVKVTHGGLDIEGGLWAGIAMLALVQLRLLMPPGPAAD